MRRRHRIQIAALGAVLSLPVSAQMTLVPDTARAVYVTGRGAVSIAPDTARVDLGVYALDVDLSRAKSRADDVMGRLVALSLSLGIAEGDLNAASVYVSPRYDEKDALILVGYEVTRSLTATLRDLSKLEALFDGAIKAGANRDFDVTLSSSKEPELRKEALAKALEDAKAQAAFVAARLGVTIGGVRSVNLDKSSSAMYSAFMVSRSETFLPGEVRVEVEAAVTFYLKDAGE